MTETVLQRTPDKTVLPRVRNVAKKGELLGDTTVLASTVRHLSVPRCYCANRRTNLTHVPRVYAGNTAIAASSHSIKYDHSRNAEPRRQERSLDMKQDAADR